MAISKRISDSDKKAIANGLSRLLADSYTLYLKTQNYHWNVTGPMFQQLHQLFEGQYNDLALAVDEIAERIRSLGFPAPGSYSAFAKLAKVKEASGIPKAMAMVKELVRDHEIVAETLHELFPKVSEAGDEATADVLTTRLKTHEKTIWMLKSLLET